MCCVCIVVIEYSFVFFFSLDVFAANSVVVVVIVGCTPPHLYVSMKINCHYEFESGVDGAATAAMVGDDPK